VAGLAKPLDDLDAIDIGKLDIDECDTRFECFDRLKSGRAIVRCNDRVPGAL